MLVTQSKRGSRTPSYQVLLRGSRGCSRASRFHPPGTSPIRVMSWGPRTGTAGPAAILGVRQLGSQALLFAPQRVRISTHNTVFDQHTGRISIPPMCKSSPCIIVNQYTIARAPARDIRRSRTSGYKGNSSRKGTVYLGVSRNISGCPI